MKKLVLTCVGLLLFVAGYFHTRRQVQYNTKATQPAPTYATSPTPAEPASKSPFAFWLTKS